MSKSTSSKERLRSPARDRRTEGARAYAEPPIERAAEMGRLAEPPIESYIGDRALAQAGILHIPAALLQPTLLNPVPDGASFFREQTMRMTHGNADSGRDLRWSKCGVR